jgi:tRNA-dihydrouridine synthase B
LQKNRVQDFVMNQGFSLKIGPVSVTGPCRLAPMAGISNTPYRLVCKEMGSGLTTSEEISAKALAYGSQKTFDLAGYLPEEKPIAMQIFGAEPEILAQAAKILADRGADLIDLNMGCPVPKITKTGAGSALMRDTEHAVKVFRAIRAAITIPFTIKIRGGWDDHHINAPEIARLAELEGVDSIAVHPRTRSQMFSGQAPWDIIKQVVQTVKVPVTGNGDVKSFGDAERMMKETGCHNVMIGRAALGKPWIFSREFERLSPLEQHDFKFKAIERHMDLIEVHMPPKFSLVQAKKHLAWYAVGVPGSAHVRAGIFACEELSALRDYFRTYWVGSRDLLSRADVSIINAVADSNAATSASSAFMDSLISVR